MLANVVPIYDAHVIKKLRAEETIFLGKTNMDEFAMGSTTESSYFQATHNPWNLDRVPGGSSGGSAAAIAAGEAIWTLGSDTGGSIRQPASFNGCVGIKPTYGRVSRYGCVAFASSLDQIGPITRDVTDAATVLNTICGKDEHDSTSLPVEVPDFTKALRQDVKGLRIGLPKEYYGEGLDPKVHAELKKQSLNTKPWALRSLRFPCLIPNMRSLPITSLLRRRLPPIWPVMTASGTVSVRLMPPARPK